MGIVYEEDQKVFGLHTKHTTYLCGLTEDGQYFGHIYYGKRMTDLSASYLLRTEEPPFTPETNVREKASFIGGFPQEYPTAGLGDYRETALAVRTEAGIGDVSSITKNMRFFMARNRWQVFLQHSDLKKNVRP